MDTENIRLLVSHTNNDWEIFILSKSSMSAHQKVFC